MATYYVRKSGSNSNNGTSPSSAWLTLTYAQTTAGGNPTPGSTIYVGAGVYRETVAATSHGVTLSTTYNGSNGSSLATLAGSITLTSVSGLIAPPAGYYNLGSVVTSAGVVMFTWTGISSSNLTGVTFLTNTTVTSAATVASSAVLVAYSATFIIGDVDGSQTGDAGQVIHSGYTTNDKTAPTATTILNLGSGTYGLTWALMTFIDGTGSIITNTAAGAIACCWVDCTFNALAAQVSPVIITGSTTGLAMLHLLDRCTVVGVESNPVQYNFATTTSGSADFDSLVLLRNCFILGNFNGGNSLDITATSTNTYKPGGLRAYNCTLVGNTAMRANTASQLSTTIPCEVHGSLVLGASTGLAAATSGQLVESYNQIIAATARSNVTSGTGSQTGYAGVVELGQSMKWAAGTVRPFFAPDGAGAPMLGFGGDGNGPSVDWLARTRPSGGGSTSYAAGYLELHDFAVQDTGVYQALPASSGKLIGPGDQYIQVPLDAVSSTISIYLYQGSGYTGSTYASVTLLANGELGTASYTQTCTSTLSTWQQLTFTAITPSKPGWVTVQITSFDTSGTGTLNFDTLGVV